MGTRAGLTAVPAPGQDFVEWIGDASGTEPSLALTLDRSRLVRARFTLRPRLSLLKAFDYPPPGGVRLRIKGEDGAWYSMERSTNLTSWARWSVVTNLGGMSVVAGPSQAGAPCFHRAVRIGP